MLKDFKKFVARGNVVDLAVGIIMGAAFTGIVNSLVKDIIMPPIGMVTGGLDFSSLYINLNPGVHYDSLKEAQAAGAATINYGVFINQVINFLIVAFAVFMLVKQVNRFHLNLLEEEKKTPALTKSEMLLQEIRDLLKSKG